MWIALSEQSSCAPGGWGIFAGCPVGYALYNGNCYKLYNNLTYAAARSRCQADGGDLAVINDAAENEFLKDNFIVNPGSGDTWIGYDDIAVEGTFGSLLHNLPLRWH